MQQATERTLVFTDSGRMRPVNDLLNGWGLWNVSTYKDIYTIRDDMQAFIRGTTELTKEFNTIQASRARTSNIKEYQVIYMAELSAWCARLAPRLKSLLNAVTTYWSHGVGLGFATVHPYSLYSAEYPDKTVLVVYCQWGILERVLNSFYKDPSVLARLAPSGLGADKVDTTKALDPAVGSTASNAA